MSSTDRAARIANILRHFPTLLGRWRGGYARFWSYSVSHTMLVIRIERPGILGNLHISCSPLVISAPVTWNNADVAITYEEGVGYLITDDAAGVRITAEVVEVAENVEPT